LTKPYTDATKILVADVLERLGVNSAEPLPEDITNRVFKEIERDPTFLRTYQALTAPNRHDSVNNAIGWVVKEQTGAQSIRESRDAPSGLNTSYRLLRRGDSIL
jgi:hypothetical protein